MSTGFQSERAAIEARFAANWTATPVRYENIAFTQPQTAWVGLMVRTGEASQISISSQPLNRYIGLIIIDVFVPENTGTDYAKQLADLAAAIFRNVQFGSTASGTITTRAPRIDPVGVNAGFYQLSVSVPYHRDLVD